MALRRVVSALLLITYLPACTSFQATTQPLPELTAPPHPVDRVRITDTTGARIDVSAPRVVNDTLFGSTWTTGAGGKQAESAVSLPLSAIQMVEVRKTDGGTTAILVIGIVGVAVVLAVVSQNTLESELGRAIN